MGFVKDICIELIKKNPELFIAVFLFLFAYFRQEITDIIRIKILKKPPQEDKAFKNRVLDIVSNMKYVSCFNEQVITTDSEELCDELKFILDKAKNESKPIVFDLSRIKQINEAARESLRDAVRFAIDQDDINLLVVFPKTNATLLWDEMQRYIKKRGTTCVQLKRDSRGSNRYVFVDGENSHSNSKESES
jgi:hypothetical protein